MDYQDTLALPVAELIKRSHGDYKWSEHVIMLFYKKKQKKQVHKKFQICFVHRVVCRAAKKACVPYVSVLTGRKKTGISQLVSH